MKCGFLVFALVANSLHLSSSVVSPPRVIDAWLDGAPTSSIATKFCCSQRHIQKLLAVEGLGQSRLPVHPRLAVVVSREVARHGANYGVKMLLGALHAHYSGFRFPRRKVLMVMKACNPTALRNPLLSQTCQRISSRGRRGIRGGGPRCTRGGERPTIFARR